MGGGQLAQRFGKRLGVLLGVHLDAFQLDAVRQLHRACRPVAEFTPSGFVENFRKKLRVHPLRSNAVERQR